MEFYLDLGGTKSVFYPYDKKIVEILGKPLIFEKEENYLVYNSKKVKEKLKTLLNALSKESKVFISIAGVPIYKDKTIKVFSSRFGQFELDKKRFFVVNDVKAFAYYWANKYDNLLAVQIGTGVNSYFYKKELLKSFEYLVSSNETGNIILKKSKVYNWLGGKKVKIKNNFLTLLKNKVEDLLCIKMGKSVHINFYNKWLSEFLINNLYTFPVENIVIGGGMSKFVSEKLIKSFIEKIDKNLKLYREIETLKVVKEKDYIYNIEGLKLIKKQFFDY